MKPSFNNYTKANRGFIGIIFLMISLLVMAWAMVFVSNSVMRPLTPQEESTTILDDARKAKSFLEGQGRY